MRFLLLHGFAGAGASWREFMDHLPDGAEVLTPNLLGHGGHRGNCGYGGAGSNDLVVDRGGEPRSQEVKSQELKSQEAPESFEGEVRRIASLLEERSAEGTEDTGDRGDTGDTEGGGWHVVGYSLGGRIALGLKVFFDGRAATGKQRLLNRVTLVGTHPGLVEEDRSARRLADEKWASLIEEKGVENFLDVWRDLPLFASQRALPKRTLAEQNKVNCDHNPRRLAAAMRILSLGRMPCYEKVLERGAVDMCWVAGALDEKFSQLGQRCAEESGGRFVAVDNVGHNVLLEAPGELAKIVLGKGR